MSEFRGPPLPFVPDNLTLPQFILDSSHPLRPARANDAGPWLIEDQSGRKYGYEELRANTFGLANALRLKYSIGENDVVCIFSGNHVDYPVAAWAVHRLGGILSTGNPAYTPAELQYQLEVTGAALLIAQPESLQTAVSAAKSAGISLDRIILLEPVPGTSHPILRDLIAYGLSQSPSFVERQLTPGESKTKVAFLCFSSGTTGKPKAVAIPHYAVIANIIQLAEHFKVTDPVRRRFGPGDLCTAVLPFFHIYGLVVNMHFSIFCGVTIVVTRQFNFENLLKNISRYRITHLMIVPPMMVLLCKHPIVKNYDLSHVKLVLCGAAPLSIELIQQMVKVLPQAIIGQGFGMTETSTVISALASDQKISTGSTGILLPGVVARVVKMDGSLAKVGEAGELRVKTPSSALRYSNNEEATKETFVDGFVHTGDEVLFNEEGELFIIDRLKELIKVRGFQVAPAELEGHLLNHPHVTDVAVVPLPDEYSGEVPLAFVVLHADALLRSKDPKEAEKIKQELMKYVSDHKTKYKWLAGGVQFIDAIPKNASGKILRRILRDRVREELKVKAKL